MGSGFLVLFFIILHILKYITLCRKDVLNIMESGRLEHKLSYSTYFSIIAGVFLGSVMYLVLYHNQSFLLEYGLEDYKVSGVLGLSEKQLLLYILRRRIGQIILYIILVLLFSYPVITALFCFNFGIYYGVAVSSFLLKFGLKAMAYLNFCFFPHYLFYFFSLYFWGKWVCIQKNNYYSEYKNVNKFTIFVKIFVIFIFLFIAIIWEAYFQKNILNFFYQHLVQ